MFNVTIDDEYIINDEGTSEGTQVKYKKDGFWYKKDHRGNEGLCEYLASKFLTSTSLSEDEYIEYEKGTINGSAGCRSKDFIKDGNTELITLYRLYRNETGTSVPRMRPPGMFMNI